MNTPTHALDWLAAAAIGLALAAALVAGLTDPRGDVPAPDVHEISTATP